MTVTRNLRLMAEAAATRMALEDELDELRTEAVGREQELKAWHAKFPNLRYNASDGGIGPDPTAALVRFFGSPEGQAATKALLDSDDTESIVRDSIKASTTLYHRDDG